MWYLLKIDNRTMKKFISNFQTVQEFNTFSETSECLKPHVSLTKDNGEVHFMQRPETRVVAKFNVTSTSSPTKIGYNEFISGFSAIEIDGVKLPSVVSAYTFSRTGEHIVKYTLTDQTSICEYAFNNCRNITNITVPDSVTSIGDCSFQNCSSLITVTIPSGVTNIGSFAFYASSGLTNIFMLYGVTNISNSTFRDCRSLTTIDIPDSVTTIGKSAFEDCTALTSCSIGSGVTSIGSDAFYYCRKVSDVYCYPNPTNLTWTEDEKNDFKSDGSTACHVYSEYLSAYQSKFGNSVNVTFVGDLT